MVTQRKEERHRAPWPARSSPPASTSQPGDDQDNNDDEVGSDNHDEVDDCGEVGYQVPSTCFFGGIFEFLRRKWQRSRSLIRPEASLFVEKYQYEIHKNYVILKCNNQNVVLV